jgi:hypothetical protein
VNFIQKEIFLLFLSKIVIVSANGAAVTNDILVGVEVAKINFGT